MAEPFALTAVSRAFDDTYAEISDCELYRYTLGRSWAREPVRRLIVCMLNPSTADAFKPDPTITKLCGFSRRLGYGGLHVVNLFALRSSDPKDLKRALKNRVDPVGPKNRDRILHAIQLSKAMKTPFVVAWGPNGKLCAMDRFVLDLCAMEGVQPMCLRVTPKSRAPEHPLYVPYSETLKPYEVTRV